jgi:hypothetical protein
MPTRAPASLLLSGAVTLLIVHLNGADVVGARTQAPPAGDCVVIGTPRPSVGYTYEHQETGGTPARFTNFWEEITETGSRVRTLRGTIEFTQVNQHRIVDDVSVVEATTSSQTGRAPSTTTFRPGIVSDPAFRACAGRSWPIAAATVTHGFGASPASATTFAGTLAIVAVREAVTVPAGEFETVRYTRTLLTPVGRSIDEYWTSIEHGVVVRHVATYPGGSSSEVLLSIR